KNSADVSLIEDMVRDYKGNLVFSSQNPPYLTYKYNKKETLLKELIELVEKMKDLQLAKK
ncbi:MAG: hypothetical protein ACPLSA_00185, partial [Caldanaerobacter sp.]